MSQAKKYGGKAFGKRLKMACLEADRSIEDVAKLLGKSKVWIYNVCRDITLSESDVKKVEEYLGTQLRD